MSKELDLDDVAAQSCLAKAELDELRKERDALRAVLEISWFALAELSPCAHEECKQIQTEALDIALRKAEEVLGHNADE